MNQTKITKMKSYLTILALVLAQGISFSQESFVLKSPDGGILITLVADKAGTPLYSVKYGDSIAIHSSKLGLVMADNDFSKKLKVLKIGNSEPVIDNYTVFSEKRSHCTYHANKRTITFSNENGFEMAIIFQVSNDGVAFRYEFAGKSDDKKKVMNEQTSFHFPLSAKAWLHPHTDAHTGWNFDQPSYEEHYEQAISVGKQSPYKAGWSFPALFQSAGCWVLLTEADVDRNYCGSRLSSQSPDGEYSISFPQPLERTDSLAPVLPETTLPFKSPWRVIMLGKSLGTIVESTLVTDLSTPCKLSDTTYIKPGKSSWTWVLYKDDSTVYNCQKRFIDYASKMNWRYCLIDAFWDKNIGYDKIKELADYAKTKNVGLILWYNSAGNWNTTPLSPRNLMSSAEARRKEFEKISKLGIKGVKVDFFGGDGQSFMNYYQDLFEDAAKYQLLVNCHGATIPRGWTRTYPNSVSMESVMGFEFVTFEQKNTDLEPTHCAMLPFTRNAIGPMDFTPVSFSEVPNLKRKTTNGFELALSILFQSGIQHYAEVPEGMFRQPEYVVDFMKQVPERWDDIKFIDGYPGNFAVIARKGDGKWYVTGINGSDKPKTFDIDLSVLGNINGVTIITDGPDNRTFSSIEFHENKVKLEVRPMGGFVITLK
jgi:hypothetical protein